MGKGIKTFGDLMTVIVVAVLFLVILLLVVFSAVSYQRAVEIHDSNNNTRAVLSYVITAVKANEASTVSVEDRDGLQVLVLYDESTGYEQQIFCREGSRDGGVDVLESYGRAGTIPSADDAIVIGQAREFEMRYVKEDLLEIKTGAGNSYVHIR